MDRYRRVVVDRDWPPCRFDLFSSGSSLDGTQPQTNRASGNISPQGIIELDSVSVGDSSPDIALVSD